MSLLMQLGLLFEVFAMKHQGHRVGKVVSGLLLEVVFEDLVEDMLTTTTS